jgi:hypothetical protein
MLKLFKRDKTSPVDEHITTVLDEMKQTRPDSEEYSKYLASLEKLYKLKAEQRRAPISSDTLATIVGSFMNILLIVAYEQKHVMTSKGFSHIIRPKT